MSAKQVSIPTKPNADKWVQQKQQKTSVGKIKRLTLDIPEVLHRKVKLKAVQEGTTIADMLRVLLEEQYG